MSNKINDGDLLVCPSCSCEFYDKSLPGGIGVGDPMIQCPSCGSSCYRSCVLEPALISAKRYYDIRHKSAYRHIRAAIIALYVVFLLIILIKSDVFISLLLVLIAFAVCLIYELIRLIHMRSYAKSDEYNSEIARSLKRLSDTSYARFVVDRQGVDDTSVYYYGLHEEQED